MKNIKIIVTAPNSDANNKLLIETLKKKVNKYKKIFYYNPSLGNRIYYSLIRLSDGVIGNSSSGISEVASFNTGTTNIGSRQEGETKMQ